MQGIIYAAGYGSRLSRPLNLKPKSLLQIGNKTIIYLMIKKLISCRVTKINIVVGYKSKLLQSYLIKNFKNKCTFNFIKNKFYKSRGNIYSAYLIKKKINEDVIILNSDLLFQKKTLVKFLNIKHKNLFLTNKKADITKDDIIFVYKKNKDVKKVYIKKKINKKISMSPASGIVKMSNKSFNDFLSIISKENLTKKKYYEEAYKKLIEREIFKVHQATERIEEIDTEDDYKKIIRLNYKKYL
ncbi:hypothetical protein IDG99_01115 [Pelagibacterales bacterium SAG-MED09]|nr:hypothetical protein [Pelagibacterales bacterium SAG-MED09]